MKHFLPLCTLVLAAGTATSSYAAEELTVISNLTTKNSHSLLSIFCAGNFLPIERTTQFCSQ